MLAGAVPYYEFPHREWSSLQGCTAPEKNSTIYIPWGVHEKERGVLDLTRSSKLCLERLLERLGDQKISARIVFGFHGPQSIPQWLYSCPRKATVYSAALDGVATRFCVTRVPHFRQVEFHEAFSSFLMETLRLLNLYRMPDGPIESVEFSPGFFTGDLSVPTADELDLHLISKYGDYKGFNAAYGTHFTSMGGEEFLKRLPVLLEKRRWIACADVRAIHRANLRKWAAELPAQLSRTEQFDRFQGVEVFDESLIVVDDLIFPFLVGGGFHPSLLRHYGRVATAFRSGLSPSPADSRLVCWADKWLGSETVKRLKERANSGSAILLVGEIPVYDEKMQVLSDLTGLKARAIKWGRSIFSFRPIGSGGIYTAATGSDWGGLMTDFSSLGGEASARH
ncbi:MAG: hypothetical protein HYR96_13625 [Deltaproteobacteria bacterium]|nr:hypothetical protein [Deltaproteobacteria bacterium]MBI3293817.1 hypothetical protein [Deltaproteobacteria bacterium]